MFKKSVRILSVFLIAIIFILSGCNQTSDNIPSNDDKNIIIEEEGLETESEQETEIANEDTHSKKENDIVEVEGNLEVHFIDVGQGDAILIKQNESSMLIDAGDNEYEEVVVNYLKENGVTKLDYVIGTHPHSDHIGGLDAVIDAFDIGKVIMPKATHNTKTFEDVIIAIKNKGLKITIPNPSDTFDLGEAKCTILAPNSDSYDNLNNYSVVLKLKYGNTSFLFTGDAEYISENEMLSGGYNLKTDVLKVGHHGSDSSTTTKFLNATNPKYAVIQVGRNNKYGHPTIEIINKLQKNNVEIYRNDLDGTIIAKSDGKNIEFNKEPSPVQVKPSPSAQSPSTKTDNTNSESIGNYIGNKNSKIFHKSTCSSLPAEKNRVYFDSVEEAINAGYRACKRCKP